MHTTPSSLVATCTPSDIGSTGRPGNLVYLAAPNTTVRTQQGFEIVVHPARGDQRGRQWQLAVTSGGNHLCRLSGNFVSSVIAAFIVRSAGTATLKATGPHGSRRLTIIARA
jgi:hypothetical protein